MTATYTLKLSPNLSWDQGFHIQQGSKRVKKADLEEPIINKSMTSSIHCWLGEKNKDRPLRLLDMGCGEGRTAVFFARNGYHAMAFDSSPKGIEKTKQLAERASVKIPMVCHTNTPSTGS